MVLSVPLADLLAFRKLAKAYFALMEVRRGGGEELGGKEGGRSGVPGRVVCIDTGTGASASWLHACRPANPKPHL